MRRRRRSPIGRAAPATLLFAGAALFLACATGPTVTTPPLTSPAAVANVVDEYFGQRVVDPYRWMEASGSVELRTWLEAQDGVTRASLSALPLHAEISARLESLAAETSSIEDVALANESLFFIERAGDAKPALRLRSRAGGAARTVASLEEGGFTSLDYVFPSPKGRYVAYGVSKEGNEDSTLFVVEVAGSRLVDRPIAHARMAEVAWLSDESGFYYTREPERPEGAPANESFTRMRVHYHSLGSDSVSDPPVFGHGMAASPFVEKEEIPRLLVGDDSPFAAAVFDHAVDDPAEVAIKRRGDVRDADKPWLRVASAADGIVDVLLKGSALYVLTFKDAPFHRLERWDLGDAGIVARHVLFVEPGLTLQKIVASRSGLYVAGLIKGVSELFYAPFEGGSLRALALPEASFVSSLVADPRRDGAAIRIESWTRAPVWLAHDPVTDQLRDTNLTKPSATSFDDVVVRQLTARSSDGTEIPLTVLHRRGLRLDGRNPTWLSAYGSYGIPLVPSFRPVRKAWLERGGVFAFAHVRGGGELGKAWHEGGQKLRKINSILDFIASAEELVREGYATPGYLAAFGQSAGGIVAHGAIVRRPELFRAAVIDVGDSNMLRLEQTPGGPMNAEEFGSVKTPEGFKALFAMDAYHHVKDGTPYPAELLATGINDPRVPPWQSAKMAARLQAATTSGRPIFLRVAFDDGHGVGSTRRQQTDRYADFFSFLFAELGRGRGEP
jgi:prolyl oligopeptidase